MFGVVTADPAWPFKDKLTMSDVPRGAEANYPTMSVEDIKALPVPSITAPNAVLALWVPSSILQDGLDVMRAWGFAQKQTYIWIKVTKDGNGLAFGMGRLFRQCHEIALIGTKGSLYGDLANKSQRSVSIVEVVEDAECFEFNEGHSKKPEALQDSLDLMFPQEAKIELFARRERPGTLCLGNALDGRDLRESLAEIVRLVA